MNPDPSVAVAATSRAANIGNPPKETPGSYRPAMRFAPSILFTRSAGCFGVGVGGTLAAQLPPAERTLRGKRATYLRCEHE